MSYASSRHRRSSRSRAGATSVEFALVAWPFLALLIGSMELGRFFITQHSLRTLTSEAARSAMVNCAGYAGTCPSATAIPAQQTLWDKVPFLTYSQTGSSLTARQTKDSNGIRTITVRVEYPFAFVLSALQGIHVNESCHGGDNEQSCPSNTICETTCVTY
jgi:hypothetical protein